jgi:SHS2 domain-containing protein
LKAQSESPQQLFEDLARQLFKKLIDPQEVGATLREKVAVEGESLEHLLQEWVTTLLDLVRVQNMVFGQFRVTELKMPGKGPYSLRAEAVGELLDTHRHHFIQNVARLACQEVDFRREPQGYSAEIAFD